MTLVLIEVLFWVSIGLLGYTFVGYHLLTRWLAMSSASIQDRDVSDSVPLITVVIVAHNEAARIQSRIENILNSDCPNDRLSVVVVSDGSTDDTVQFARSVQ